MSLVQMSFAGAVIILIVTIIRGVGMNKLPKAAFLALWGVALVRLLIPYTVPSPWSVYSLWERLASPVNAPGTIPAAIPASPAAPIPPVITGATHQAAPSAGASAVHMDPWTVIWAVGAVACGAFFAVSYFKCRREFKTSLPVDNDVSRAWLKAHRLKRPITIRYSDRISAPLTYGVFRPVILMPKTADWSDGNSMEYILTHEYVHIRRFDAVTKLLLTAALCVHWFNPAVWLMVVLANRDMELSCDEAVIRLFGEDTKAEYAMTLIRMEETRSGPTPLCNNFSKNAIEERISAIMKTKKATWLATILAVALIVGVTTGFATTGRSGAADEAEDLIEAHESDVPKAAEAEPAGSGAVPGKTVAWGELCAAGMPSEFLFCSGAGGWSTWLSVGSGGTFTGHFEDGEMGSSDPQKYPGGTAYVCDFAGAFSQPVQVDEYTLSVQVERLEIQAREETIEDGVRYLPATPYGMENADDMLILLPGKPVGELSEDILGWLRGSVDWKGDSLPFYALVNVHEQQAFCGWTIQP